MSEKKERMISPIGESKWAHVHTPKPAFKDKNGAEKGSPKFQIDVVFDPENAEWKEWASKVATNVRELPIQFDKGTGEPLKKQMPIKRELDENEKPTGKMYVTFKTSSEFKPSVFDKFGSLIPETTLIGNGSKVRVSYLENKFDAFGGGVNFYLNAVQVLELIEHKPMSAESYGFASEAGVSPFSVGDKKYDDDLPF